MNGSLLWLLAGIAGTLVTVWLVHLARRWYHRRRYGQPIAHEELLVQFGRRMVALLDRGALARLLAEDVSGALDVSRATVLLAESHDLVALDGSGLRLPVLHAAVRWVASSGEAMRVEGRLRELIAQGRGDLDWTALWVPLMRGADLHGLWLLGERRDNRAYAPEDRRWLTTLAHQAAVVLQTIRYAEQEQQVAHAMQALYRQAVAARESERGRLDAQSAAPIHIEIAAENLDVSEDTALAIYRIAQEALHNAIQHADASEIAVRLTRYPDRLRMTITDDGRGIPDSTDLGRFVAQGHFGLAGMRERAAMIGGALEVQSAADYGTAVILEVPC